MKTSVAQQGLSPADYVIFVLMVAISSLIGVFYAVRSGLSRSTEGYLMAGRTMTAIPTGISLAVTFQSTVVILGIPNDVYFYGITYICTVISKVIACFLVCYVFVPVLYSLRIWSAYEYLGKRFSKSTRLLATCMNLMANIIHIGINIYGAAVTLSGVAGFDLLWGMLSTGLICMIYTSLGGLRGVIWTDVFQGLIMLLGMLAIIVRGSMLQGGFDKVWEIGSIGFSPDPRVRYTFWAIALGGIVTWTGIFGTNQCQVQRLLSVKSPTEAKKALTVGVAGMCLCGILAILCGLVGYTIFHNCDPWISGCVSRPDEIYAFAIFNIFRDTHGLIGLFLATMFSACFSTISSNMNSMVTILMADIIKPHTDWREKTYTWLARGMTPVCGCLGLGFGILASTKGDIIKLAIGCMSATIGPSLGIFLLGIWFPFVNSWGAVSGFVSGFASALMIFVGSANLKSRPKYLTGYLNFNTSSCPADCDFSMTSNTTYFSIENAMPSAEVSDYEGIDNLFAVSVFYLSSISLIITLLLGVVVGLLTGGWQRRHDVDGQLINPLFQSRPLVWAVEKGRGWLRVSQIDRNNPFEHREVTEDSANSTIRLKSLKNNQEESL